MLSLSYFILPASLATLALARTDLTGCTTTDVSSPAGASVAWYVPGTGEICAFLDCGGGMAPPSTNVPGCPLYSGTSTYSPSYLAGFGSATAAAVPSSLATATATAPWTSGSMASAGAIASSWSSAVAGAGMSITTTVSSATATTATSSPLVGSTGSTSGGARNGTAPSATNSPSTTNTPSINGAAENQAWMGAAGLIAGLGALVVAL